MRLQINSEPQFARQWQEQIDLVPEGATYDLKTLDLELSPQFLQELTERVRGLLSFHLFHGDEVVGTSEKTVEPILLATRKRPRMRGYEFHWKEQDSEPSLFGFWCARGRNRKRKEVRVRCGRQDNLTSLEAHGGTIMGEAR